MISSDLDTKLDKAHHLKVPLKREEIFSETTICIQRPLVSLGLGTHIALIFSVPWLAKISVSIDFHIIIINCLILYIDQANRAEGALTKDRIRLIYSNKLMRLQN